MRLTLSMALIAASLISASLWVVARASVAGEPELLSSYPFGGQQGTEVQTTLRGRSLDQVSTIWFDCDQLSATVVGVESDKSGGPAAAPKKKKKGGASSSTAPLQLMTLRVKVAQGADAGVHYLRVLTPRGISNPLPFRVHSEPAVSEDPGAHELPKAAQVIRDFPVVINGKIATTGEVDYYSFDVQQGESLRFDALTAGGALDPALTLFEATGSWFQPDRLTELAFNDEEVSYPGFPVNAAITYKFPHKGRYFVRVNGFLGESGSDYSYQLSVRRAAADKAPTDLMRPAHLVAAADSAWQERSWKRELKADRLTVLSSRGGELAPMHDVPVVRLGGHDSKGEPVAVTIPSLLEGVIERPAKIDRVKFKVKAGDRIALEIETVRKTIPQFNPYLRIVSTGGDEAFTNVHSTVNTCGDLILKQVQPKTIYSFPREGEYILEIRDITHLYGDSSFAYRVMLRQQVPHMGDIRVSEEQINVMPGEATKVSVDTDQEEGFDGQIALTVEGLPEGVRQVTATELQPHVPPAYNAGKVERFLPESQKATFLFVTDRAAAPTSKPVEASIVAQPVLKGKLGHPVVVKKILFTVAQSGNRPQKESEPKTPETR